MQGAQCKNAWKHCFVRFLGENGQVEISILPPPPFSTSPCFSQFLSFSHSHKHTFSLPSCRHFFEFSSLCLFLRSTLVFNDRPTLCFPLFLPHSHPSALTRPFPVHDQTAVASWTASPTSETSYWRRLSLKAPTPTKQFLSFSRWLSSTCFCRSSLSPRQSESFADGWIAGEGAWSPS